MIRILAALGALSVATLLAGCEQAAPPAPDEVVASAGADVYSIANGMTLARPAPGVLANDDVDPASVTVTLARKPRYGELELAADGSFSYTPNYQFPGADEFNYAIVRGEEVSAPIAVTIRYPNVVVMLVDDLGLGDLRIHNDAALTDTPNITALAAAGLRFNRMHAPTAVCSPSRYSVLTGNLPHRGRISTGVWETYTNATMYLPGQQTLADIFVAAGYRTGFVGKQHTGGLFHNRYDEGYTGEHGKIDFTQAFDGGPTDLGFDYSFVLPGGVGTAPYAYFENDRLVRYDSPSGGYQPFTSNQAAHESFVRIDRTWGQLYNDGKLGADGWAMDNYDSRRVGSIVTRKALEFISADSTTSDEPFFLYFAPPQLHRPYTPPEFFDISDTDDSRPSESGTAVAGSSGVTPRADIIREIDLMVGALVSALEAGGMLENTLLILSSDNGAIKLDVTEPQRPQGSENGVPLRGSKGDIHEGGHRIPMIVRWGGAAAAPVAPGSSSAELAGLHDLAGTFLALLGQQRPAGQMNDSRSLLPVLLNGDGDVPLRDHLIVQGSPLSAADNLGYINRAYYKRDADNQLWKLTSVASQSDPLSELRWVGLYNLSADPGEARNLLTATAHASWRDTLQSEYRQLIAAPRTVVAFR